MKNAFLNHQEFTPYRNLNQQIEICGHTIEEVRTAYNNVIIYGEAIYRINNGLHQQLVILMSQGLLQEGFWNYILWQSMWELIQIAFKNSSIEDAETFFEFIVKKEDRYAVLELEDGFPGNKGIIPGRYVDIGILYSTLGAILVASGYSSKYHSKRITVSFKTEQEIQRLLSHLSL